MVEHYSSILLNGLFGIHNIKTSTDVSTMEQLGVVVVVLSSQPEWVDTHSKLQWGKGGAWLAMADAPPIVLCIKELVKGHRKENVIIATKRLTYCQLHCVNFKNLRV